MTMRGREEESEGALVRRKKNGLIKIKDSDDCIKLHIFVELCARRGSLYSVIAFCNENYYYYLLIH